MKLTVNGKLILLPQDAKVTIERNSPYSNDNAGTFSFPFPVPNLPNQLDLQFPGKLSRAGNIPDQYFILEETGIQIFRGIVAYDQNIYDQIGMILQSGNAEFFALVKDKYLTDIDYGSEWWEPGANSAGYTISPDITDKLAAWDIANTTDNGKYVATPFWIKDSVGGDLNVNQQDWIGPMNTKLGLFYTGGFPGIARGIFCLQFRVSFILQTIFTSQGYTIIENALASSQFYKAIMFGKIINIGVTLMDRLNIIWDKLEYSVLMPDILITDFLTAIKTMFGLVYEINEIKREVHIKFLKDLFLPANLDPLVIPELLGWIHEEVKSGTGMKLRYTGQDNDLDTKTDFTDNWFVTAPPLPAPAMENSIYLVMSTGRYYCAVKNSSGSLAWQEIGRLEESGIGDLSKSIDINVKVPAQKTYVTHSINLEAPSIPSIIRDDVNYLTNVPLIITLYHGRKTMAGLVNFPFATADEFSQDVTGAIDLEMSLKPHYLMVNVYQDYMAWKSYRARGFTKYVQLSLKDLVALQWGKRYMINGIAIILDKVTYDLPYTGQVQIDGFTA